VGVMGACVVPSLLASPQPSTGIVQSNNELIPGWVASNLQGGRVTVLPDWLPPTLLSSLRSDARSLFAEGGHFKPDALAAYSIKKQQQRSGDKNNFDVAYDRTIMPSFFASTGKDGPFANFALGDGRSRQQFAVLMESLRRQLAVDLGRPTLGLDRERTNEMSYSRYGPGAFLPRHTDEHHGELKKAHPVASGDENLRRVTSKSLTATADASSAASSDRPTRRSVTWLVYLNDDDWDADVDGGQLRVHERAAFSDQPVGARGADLQVGWLKATGSLPEQPVFLDASLPGRSNCALWIIDDSNGRRRDLGKPFPSNPGLYLAGGDALARILLIRAAGGSDSDAERFHLVDAPKSAASRYLPSPGPEGVDGGERVLDISPKGGTLVLFDSVSLPHEVLASVGRERLAVTGWFHEMVYPPGVHSSQTIF